MIFNRKNLTDTELLILYRQLLLPRMIEEKMLVLLRQGKVGKWFSGIGQEAISVGTVAAMEPDEWVMPMHRNLGVFTGRNMPFSKLFLQWQGNSNGYSKGRERSFHFGSKEHHICGMISHLGPQLAIANGVALAHALRAESKCAVAFTGEGGTSEGDFHEALNVAAVWDLPVIFIIENNGYGLSTPTSEQYHCTQLIDKAKGYGMEAVQIDGNNILTVFDTIKGVREYCIANKKPYLIECLTFRMRGHEEASGIKYVPPHLLNEWKQKDPIENYEFYLSSIGVLSNEKIQTEREKIADYIETELGIANNTKHVFSNEENELNDVYAIANSKVKSKNVDDEMVIIKSSRFPTKNISVAAKNEDENISNLRFVDAIQQGLKQSMEHNPSLVLMGQDIAEYGGAFKVTEGFVEMFGKHRVRNTPLCESAIVGTALGLSLEGIKSVVEMQFADFVSVGFNQIINNLAKLHYRWGQSADVVVRMPCGGGMGAGPFHSQSNEAWFVHTPGLKVVYPSNPADAKGLLIAAINDPNPVLFFEHKGLYRSIEAAVPEAYFETEIGKAKIVKTGSDATIISYGMGVHWAMEYQAMHPEISLYILDLRTLLPLDYEAIEKAISATGKLLVLHEDTLTGGIGGEISAWAAEHCFGMLDAPIIRCGSLDTPIPFNANLEKQFMAKSKLDNALRQLLGY